MPDRSHYRRVMDVEVDARGARLLLAPEPIGPWIVLCEITLASAIIPMWDFLFGFDDTGRGTRIDFRFVAAYGFIFLVGGVVFGLSRYLHGRNQPLVDVDRAAGIVSIRGCREKFRIEHVDKLAILTGPRADDRRTELRLLINQDGHRSSRLLFVATTRSVRRALREVLTQFATDSGLRTTVGSKQILTRLSQLDLKDLTATD